MAVSYGDSVKSLRMQIVADSMNNGTGPAILEICEDAYATVLITYTLNDPAATTLADVLTLLETPINAVASFSGTAAVARIKDSDDNVIVQGLTVGTSASDVILSSTTINATSTYTLTAGTITHAA